MTALPRTTWIRFSSLVFVPAAATFAFLGLVCLGLGLWGYICVPNIHLALISPRPLLLLSQSTTMSTLDAPWLLPTLSLLTATISVIIRPSGHQTFVKDVKDNILSFSPFRSGRGTTSLIFYIFSLRLLNLAGIHTGLKVLSYLHFLSESPVIEPGFWTRFARRVFLVGVTLPIYVTLLVLTSHRWLHALTTSLLAECVLVELLEFYWNPSHDAFIVRRDWPRRTMLMAADSLNHDHFENEGEAEGSGEKKEDGNMAPPPASKDNICDRIRRLWSTEADSDIYFTMHSISPRHALKLERIFSVHAPTAKWTCGHCRCAIYTISCVAQRIIFFSWYLEQASTAWLLHVAMHPVTLRVADKVLENNILGGLLTMFYQISLLAILVASAFISAILLFLRLRKHERIEKAFRALVETAPITYSALDIFGKMIMPSIASYISTRALFPRDPSLTSKMLSCVIDIAVILILCAIGYRLLFSRAISEPTTQAEPETKSNPTPSSEPKMAPKSSYHDPPNLAATPRHQTLSNDKAKAPDGGSKYPYVLVGSGFQIFRLAIWASSSIFWIYSL